MKDYAELRMTGTEKDLVLSKKTEIVHSIAERSEEQQVYLLKDKHGSNIHIQLHQRIYVNYFIIDVCHSPVNMAESSFGYCDKTHLRITSKPLTELILHVLKLNDILHDHEVQNHYVDIICRYLDTELAGTEPLPVNMHTKHKVMEKLRQHIDRNIKQNLSVKNLLDICHMSERSLYYLFRENESMTPLSYIQQRKIERVYRELSTQRTTKSITQIAMEYGFSNLGRFSQLYRNQVGELPSVTRSRSAFPVAESLNRGAVARQKVKRSDENKQSVWSVSR